MISQQKRENRINLNRSKIRELEKKISEDHLVGVAQASREKYPEARFVRIVFPWKAIGRGTVRVIEVCDDDYHKISDTVMNKAISSHIEWLLGTNAVESYVHLESGEYDFKEFAERP